MRKITASTTLGYILLLFIAFHHQFAIAQNKPQSGNAENFELKNDDRVVFLGNSLLENDQQYGYLEQVLTSRWPDRNVTYRNLGWEGDNVFGDARSYFTNPPTAYELLIKQIKEAKPTVVFIAYGGIEAQDGEKGLPRFLQGLNQLLDTIDNIGAKSILLSPIPILLKGSAEKVAPRNKNLEVYAAAIAKTATTRHKKYIDIFSPLLEFNEKAMISDNGVHLNETGYYYLANILEKSLGLPSKNETVTLTVSKDGLQANGIAKVLTSNKDQDLKFSINESYLPLPVPAEVVEPLGSTLTIKVNGLKKGFYTLTADHAQVLTASAKQWAEGIKIKHGASYNQAELLRRLILKKNNLFFQQYRPMNRTYIVGFRSYEQGRHKEGLKDLDLIITWLEGQIALTRTPKDLVYQLTQIK